MRKILLAAILALNITAAKAETLTIVTEGAFKPWNFSEADGTLAGYEIDLAWDLCARMKATCTIVAQDFSASIPGLLAKKFDIIMTAMLITPKREEAIAFSRPYGRTPQLFAVRKDGDLTKLDHSGELFSLDDEAASSPAIAKLGEELAGKTIGVQGAASQSAFLTKYFGDKVTVREYKTTEEHNADLVAGRVDAVMAALSNLSDFVTKEHADELTFAGPRFVGGVLGKGVGAGFRKEDTALKAKFEEALAAAVADGTVAKLSVKWFGFDMLIK